MRESDSSSAARSSFEVTFTSTWIVNLKEQSFGYFICPLRLFNCSRSIAKVSGNHRPLDRVAYIVGLTPEREKRAEWAAQECGAKFYTFLHFLC